MASPGDDYQSPIITQILNSVGNSIPSSAYIRDTIYDPNSNRVEITTTAANHTITIENTRDYVPTDPIASITIDYKSGDIRPTDAISWLDFRNLFSLSTSDISKGVTIDGTAIIIDSVFVKDVPANIAPIDFHDFTNITLTNCVFDILAIEHAFSQPGPISISIDSSNDFSKVYSFNHLFDGCNTLENIIFKPITPSTFTFNYGLANLYSDPSRSISNYLDSRSRDAEFTLYTLRPINLNLFSFDNCNSCNELFNGTTFLTSITLNDSDFSKNQTAGTYLKLGNYTWKDSYIFSTDSETKTIYYKFFTWTSFDLYLSDEILNAQAGNKPYSIELSDSISNIAILSELSENSNFEDLPFSSNHVILFSDLTHENEYVQKTEDSKISQGFLDIFSGISLTFSNCKFEKLWFSSNTTTTINNWYPFTNFSFNNCYFGPISLWRTFYNCILCSSITFTNCDTSNVTNLAYAFYGLYSLTEIDLSNLNLINLLSLRQTFYFEESFSYYRANNMNELITINSLLTTIRLPLNLPKLLTINNAFTYCRSLKNIYFPSSLPSLCGFGDLTYNIDLYTGGKFIKNYMILTTNISETISEINYDYGIKCEQIKKIPYIENSPTNGDFYSGVDSTFIGCDSLEYLKLPDMNVVRQLNFTFYGCTNLKVIEFGEMDSLEIIFKTFNSCNNLQKVIFPSCLNLRYIYNPFIGCTSLRILKMYNCPNVQKFNRFLETVGNSDYTAPAPIEELVLDGFNNVINTNSTTHSNHVVPNQLIFDYSSSTSTDYAYSLFNSNASYSIRKLKLSGFNGTINMNCIFGANVSFTRNAGTREGVLIFNNLEKLELNGFLNCAMASTLVSYNPSVQEVKLSGFPNLNYLGTAFANTSRLKKVILNFTKSDVPIDFIVMFERANSIEEFTFKGPRYVTNINFMNYCNNLKYLDISGMRCQNINSLGNSPIIRQIVDDEDVPVGWTLESIHLTSLIVPNLYSSYTPSITTNADIPIACENYKKAIVTEIGTNTLKCKISIMMRYFIRRSTNDIPPFDWINPTGGGQISSKKADESTISNLGCFTMDGTYTVNNTNYVFSTDITITGVSNASNYMIGMEYIGPKNGESISEVTTINSVAQTAITNISYPCSFYSTRPNILWICSRANTLVNIEEYGFATSTFPPDTYLSPIISSNNSPN